MDNLNHITNECSVVLKDLLAIVSPEAGDAEVASDSESCESASICDQASAGLHLQEQEEEVERSMLKMQIGLKGGANPVETLISEFNISLDCTAASVDLLPLSVSFVESVESSPETAALVEAVVA